MRWAGLASRVRRRFREDRLGLVASSLTFTTLLALVPIITIMLTAVSAFPMFEEWSIAFKRFLLTTLVPDSAGKVISIYMLQFSSNANKLTAIGLVILAVTAISLMMTIEAAFNDIWHVHRSRSLVAKLSLYWSIITLSPLLIGASLSISSWAIKDALSGVGELRGASALLIAGIPYLLTVLAESPLHFRFAGGFLLILPSIIFIFAVRKYLFAMWGIANR